MNLRKIALTGALAAIAAGSAVAGPVEDTLVIDGAVEIPTMIAAPAGHPLGDTLYSGWRYRTDETRALQADSFDNPGSLHIERGAEIWSTVEGSAGKSCASCHGDAAETMAGVGARYPVWDEATQRPINLELTIDRCRTERMGADAYKFDADEQLSLVTFVKHQSLGEPTTVDLAPGEMQSWWKRGEEYYYTRQGQLNLSCASCHEQNNGNFIRADHLSQGQSNGFPTYRLKDGLVSIHNRFRGCLRDVRAERPAAFSDELMALEVYVAWRGQGLPVETPSVRQ